MPFEELFAVVREYADDRAEACECAETAATFLMLVREAMFKGRD